MKKFREIRRKDRILDDGRAHELLETGEYGFLSLGQGEEGYGYGVPMSYAYDRQAGVLYFHCAPEGHKMECLGRNPRVSFCVVGKTQPVQDKFTTIYESAIAFGTVEFPTSDEDRRTALRALVRKYSPDFAEKGEHYMEKSLPRAQTFLIRIEHISAKCKR